MRCVRERERGRRKDEGETLREVRHNMSKNFIKLHLCIQKKLRIHVKFDPIL